MTNWVTKLKAKWVHWKQWRWPYIKRDWIAVTRFVVTYPHRLWVTRWATAKVGIRLDWYAERQLRDAAQKRVKILEEALALQGPADVKWKEECARLHAQVKVLKADITTKRDALERKNRELDALHYVWCNGGCESGTHRYAKDHPNEETVRSAVRNVNRLVTWFNNHEFKHLDELDEDGVRNRLIYIYGTQAYKEACVIAKEKGPAEAWQHIDMALTQPKHRGT